MKTRQQYEDVWKKWKQLDVGDITENRHDVKNQKPYYYLQMSTDVSHAQAPNMAKRYAEIAVETGAYLVMNVHDDGDVRLSLAVDRILDKDDLKRTVAV